MLHARFSGGRHGRAARFATALALAVAARDVSAQTDYYNTDAGRPITIEDATAIERRALEIQLAPLRLARRAGGTYEWGLEPEIALGILPRTQVEIGAPLVFADGAERTSGLAGIHVSALHNLNIETRLPALAISAAVLVPLGSLAPDDAFPSLKAIATKTFPVARFHVNGSYTFGEAPPSGATDGEHAGAELSRWIGGLAIDRAYALRALLVTAEVVARQPIVEAAEVEWSAGAGIRHQVSPRLAADAGAGYRLTGEEGWYATVGAALAIGLPWSPKR